MHQADTAEAEKLRQLLTYEETRRCDLEGILDQAHKEARDQKHQMQAQVICCCYLLQMSSATVENRHFLAMS